MKIQKKPLAIELIRQLDIYKYDPWDLPSKILIACTSTAELLESWTICRIFKKINSPKQKAQLESWVPPKPKTINSNIFSISTVNTRFSSGKHSCITEGRYEIQFGCNNNMQQQPKYLTNQRPSVLHVSDAESQNNMAYSSVDPSKTPPLLVDVAPIILKIPPERLASDRTLASKDFRQTQQSDFLKVDTQLGIKWNYGSGQEGSWIRGPLNTCNLSSELGENMRMMSSPINLLTDLPNEWKPYFTCHSEMSTGYSSSKCHN
ncbi:hypothetical protein J5N97_005777 [Dioscorea zingiberensis]|uniref:Uncharacterized protein n=1 Tax=Dioscorea zingiberensis TaxID=325984 RepID=A0A9D5HSZ8_9LILI|nr:hypothetical protein J5N97_005777 [Dioscorea zingiberensis]